MQYIEWKPGVQSETVRPVWGEPSSTDMYFTTQPKSDTRIPWAFTFHQVSLRLFWLAMDPTLFQLFMSIWSF